MTLNCCIQQIYWGSWKVLKHLRTDVSVNQDTFVKLTWESQLCWQKFKSRSVAVHWRKRKMWTCGLPSTRQYMFQDSPQKFNLGMCWKSFNVNTLLVINALLFHSCRISLFFFYELIIVPTLKMPTFYKIKFCTRWGRKNKRSEKTINKVELASEFWKHGSYSLQILVWFSIPYIPTAT